MSVLRDKPLCIIKLDFWTLYFAFIIAMPYDVFSGSAIISLEQPEYILNYRISVFYFSVLFIPFVLYGMMGSLKANKYLRIHPLNFLFLICLKDIIAYLFNVFSAPQGFWFSTYGNYIVASLYFICVTSVYQESVDDFIKIYAVINVLTLVFSIITGVGQGHLTGRSHMSALHQGETAAVLSILSLYFGFKKRDSINWAPIVLGIVFILSTGNRKDVAFIMMCVVLFFLRKRGGIIHRIERNQVLFAIVIIIGTFFVIVGIGNKLLSLFDFTRYTNMLFSISNQGLISFITSDGSFIGRIASLQAGFKIVRDNPILGGMFSLINCQQKMQGYGYPTFPHSTVLYLYCVMGILAIVPVFMFLKTGIKLIRINHPLQFTFIYIMIRDIISGGANEAIKYLLLMMLILNIGKCVTADIHMANIESIK